MQLGERHERTAFERGIRSFTNLLVKITGVLIVVIVAINLARGQAILNTALFALAVAVGLTPQLLPALVSLSLARGSQLLAEQEVVVKRLVAIEDLGNIDVLYTDKTGTLTAGRITLQRAAGPTGDDDVDVWRLARLCSDVTLDGGTVSGGNPLDRALWDDPTGPDTSGAARRAVLPFDHDRQVISVLVDDLSRGRTLITKGAPEAVLDRCSTVLATGKVSPVSTASSHSRSLASVTRRSAGTRRS